MMRTPVIELLGLMVLKQEEDEAKGEKEQYDRYINFLSMHHIHPPQDDKQEKSREKFGESLKPSGKKAEKKSLPTTDYNKLSKYRAGQYK